jgi:hypothetical protein
VQDRFKFEFDHFMAPFSRACCVSKLADGGEAGFFRLHAAIDEVALSLLTMKGHLFLKLGGEMPAAEKHGELFCELGNGIQFCLRDAG